MEYEIVKLKWYSGDGANVYSIIPRGCKQTLFTDFVEENNKDYKKEVLDIQKRIYQIGKEFGAREQFFKMYEGKLGDLVTALYDEDDAHLRLYCIRYGMDVIILGGGGFKDVAKWQDDEKLKESAETMIAYSNDIFRRMNEEHDLEWSDDHKEIIGDLKNYDDE